MPPGSCTATSSPRTSWCGTTATPRCVDFGLARLIPAHGTLSEASAAAVTDPGTVLGTVRYMSPEQARAEPAGGASDLFSLGVVLYELATGQHPFPAESQLGTLHAILSQPPLRPSLLNPEIPAPLEALILRMLEKEPRLRPTAAEVDAALAELTGTGAGPMLGPAPTPVPRHTVGRQKELAELRAGLESAAAGRGLFLCVTGEPGIGKTTLVEDFLAELAAAGRACTVARGRCSERLAGAEAYLPFLEALESLLHGAGGEAVARVMKVVAPTWYAQVVPRAAEDSSFARVLLEEKAASQERLKRELGAFLQEVSRPRPLAPVPRRPALGRCLDRRPAGLHRQQVRGAAAPAGAHLPPHGPVAEQASVRPGQAGPPGARRLPRGRPGVLDPPGHRALPGPGVPRAPLPGGVRGPDPRQDGRQSALHGRPAALPARPAGARPGAGPLGVGAIAPRPGARAARVGAQHDRAEDRLSSARRTGRLLVAASVQGSEFDSAVVARALALDAAEVEEQLERLERVHAFVRLVRRARVPRPDADAALPLRPRALSECPVRRRCGRRGGRR